MGNGKGRRRRQANYLAAHGGEHKLPAPPTATDAAAVPRKLRRIMTLKASSSPHNPSSHLSLDLGKNRIRSKSETNALQRSKGIAEKQHRIMKSEKQQDTSLQARDVGEGHENSAVLPNESVAPKRKKRKREEDLQLLMEKFKATPIHKGLNDRKKRYLQEKKNKKKPGRFNSVEPNPSLHQRERIGFGDIVDAPPRLSFPKKNKNISEERLRQQAVETYRQKKKWLSRPGSHQPPPLANANLLSL